MLKLTNPKDDSNIATELREASEADVDQAVEYATRAFETGEWSKFTGGQRGKCLNKLADLMDEHADEIAYFESIASGRAVSGCAGDIPIATSVIRCEFNY